LKLALRSLDASGLSLALPMGGKDEPSPRIAVRTAKGLGGELETKDAGFSLRGLSADSVELDRLHLDFETVVLAVESRGEPGAPGVLRRVTGGVAHEGHVVIDAEAGEVHATPLRVDVTTVGVRVDHPSFVIEALPAEAFEWLLVASAELGDVIDDDPPYRLEVALRGDVRGWCELSLVPDAGASTVSVAVAGEPGYPAPDVELVRDLFITAVNSL